MTAHFSRFLALGALCLGPVTASHASTITARTSYTWSDNLGHSANPLDHREAGSVGLGVTYGTTRQLSPDWIMHTDFNADLNLVPEYDELNSAEFGPKVSLKRKFGLGPMVPVLNFEGSVLGHVGNLDKAEGVIAKGAVTLSKRLNYALAVSVKAEARRDWSESDIYDVHQEGLSAAVTFDPHPRLRLSTGVGHLRGLFVASAPWSRYAGALGGGAGPAVQAYYSSIPYGSVNTFAPGWTAYRVYSEVDVFYFEVSPAISDYTSVSFRYERARSTNKANVRYEQEVYQVALVHAF